MQYLRAAWPGRSTVPPQVSQRVGPQRHSVRYSQGPNRVLVVDENVRVPLYPTTNNQDDWATLARRFPFSYYAIAAAVRNLSPTPTITWTQTMGASLDAILADLKSPFVSHSHTSLTRPPPAPAPAPAPAQRNTSRNQPTVLFFW